MTHPNPTHQPAPEPPLPKLYTVQEIAAWLRWSPKTVTRRFEGVPGVWDLSDKRRRPGKQRYRMLRITDEALQRVMGEWEVR